MELLESLQTLISRLRREKREQHQRHVSVGDLFTDRWEIARDYGFRRGHVLLRQCADPWRRKSGKELLDWPQRDSRRFRRGIINRRLRRHQCWRPHLHPSHRAASTVGRHRAGRIWTDAHWFACLYRAAIRHSKRHYNRRPRSYRRDVIGKSRCTKQYEGVGNPGATGKGRKLVILSSAARRGFSQRTLLAADYANVDQRLLPEDILSGCEGIQTD